jgi:hypothetical protein
LIDDNGHQIGNIDPELLVGLWATILSAQIRRARTGGANALTIPLHTGAIGIFVDVINAIPNSAAGTFVIVKRGSIDG